jgi:hypothetical protein
VAPWATAAGTEATAAKRQRAFEAAAQARAGAATRLQRAGCRPAPTPQAAPLAPCSVRRCRSRHRRCRCRCCRRRRCLRSSSPAPIDCPPAEQLQTSRLSLSTTGGRAPCLGPPGCPAGSGSPLRHPCPASATAPRLAPFRCTRRTRRTRRRPSSAGLRRPRLHPRLHPPTHRRRHALPPAATTQRRQCPLYRGQTTRTAPRQARQQLRSRLRLRLRWCRSG